MERIQAGFKRDRLVDFKRDRLVDQGPFKVQGDRLVDRGSSRKFKGARLVDQPRSSADQAGQAR